MTNLSHHPLAHSLVRASAPNKDKLRALRTRVARRTLVGCVFWRSPPPRLSSRERLSFGLAWWSQTSDAIATREWCRSSLRASAKQSSSEVPGRIASSLSLLAMTNTPTPGNNQRRPFTSMSKRLEQTFTPQDFQKRFDAAVQAAQREYCDIFGFWRSCRFALTRSATRLLRRQLRGAII
jgi:hypothetical protein